MGQQKINLIKIYKKTLIVLSVFVGIWGLILIPVIIYQNRQAANHPIQPPLLDINTYKSSQDNFEVKLPLTWKDAQVVISEEPNYPNPTSYIFTLPNHTRPTLWILIYSAKINLDKEIDSKVGDIKLAQSDQRVYVAHFSETSTPTERAEATEVAKSLKVAQSDDVSTQKTSNVDWKTYSGNGFQIQYPADWSIHGSEGMSNGIGIGGPGADLDSIGISYYKNVTDRPTTQTNNTNMWRVEFADGSEYFYRIDYGIRYNQTWEQLEKIVKTFKFASTTSESVLQENIPTMDGVEFNLPLGVNINRSKWKFEVNDSKSRTLFSFFESDAYQNYIKNLFNISSFPTTTPPTEISGSQTLIQRKIGTVNGIEEYGYVAEGHLFSDYFYFKGKDGKYIILELNPVFEGRLQYEEGEAYDNWVNTGIDPILYAQVRDSLHVYK